MFKGTIGFRLGRQVFSQMIFFEEKRTFDETDWEPGVSVPTGVHVKRDARSSNLRLGIEGYVGRAILGEFALNDDEMCLTVGIFFDVY